MASVVDWVPQLTGALRTWAGCPGSNGSTMAANDGADVAAGAEGLPDGDVVAGPVLLLDDEEPLPQPAARPTRAANTAARVRERLIIGSS